MFRPEMHIAGRAIGSALRPLVIAEVGINHNGDLGLVLKLMAHLTDTDPADAKDVLLNTMQRLVPAA